MIFVDTSVWVAAFQSVTGPEARHLRELLDDKQVALPVPVEFEILAGASQSERENLRRLLSALPIHLPDEATWGRIDRWIDLAADAGERFGVADLLIGAIAADHDGAVWSLDHDFARMEPLGFVRAHSIDEGAP